MMPFKPAISPLATSPGARVPAAPNPAQRTPENIRAAAQEFEAMFVAQMLKPVFEGLPQGGMFQGGPGEKIFQGLLVEEYGKAIAGRGNLGIAQIVEQDMLARQRKAEGDG